MFPQHPRAELEIGGQSARPREAERIAAGAAMFLDTAKRNRGLSCGFVAIQAALLQALRFHFDVEAHFVAHVAIELRGLTHAAPEGAQVREETSHRLNFL